MFFFILLVFLSLSATPTHAITKENAIKICEDHLSRIQSQNPAFPETELSHVYTKMTLRLKQYVDHLKKAEDPKEIYDHRRGCDQATKALHWFIENFSVSPNQVAQVSSAPSSQKTSTPPPTVSAPEKSKTPSPPPKETPSPQK